MSEVTLPVWAAALALALAVAAAMIAAVLWTRLAALRGENARLGDTGEARDRAAAEARALAERRLVDQTRAEADREAATSAVTELRMSVLAETQRREETERGAAEASRDKALALQELDQAKRSLDDWQKLKEEFLASAKSAVLQTSAELSTKLLADHKQETETARRHAEEHTKATAKQVSEQFEKLVQTVAALDGEVTRRGEMIEGVMRALTSPGGAGQFGEIGLENSLKSLGLEPGRDFVMQFAAWGEEGSLRPDAVVFLPGSAVMIIDSKASKFLMDPPEAEGQETEAEAQGNLVRTMKEHLKGLTARDYRAAVVEMCRRAGRDTDIQRALTVMCLPSEAAVERVVRADPSFLAHAARSHILVSGPIGLQGYIGMARVQLDIGKQAENQREIVEATSQLLEAIRVALDHAGKVGRGLQTASESFAKLAASINARLLPRAKALLKMGVRPAGDRPLPADLPVFQVHALKAADTIEGEIIEAGDDPAA